MSFHQLMVQLSSDDELVKPWEGMSLASSIMSLRQNERGHRHNEYLRYLEIVVFMITYMYFNSPAGLSLRNSLVVMADWCKLIRLSVLQQQSSLVPKYMSASRCHSLGCMLQ